MTRSLLLAAGLLAGLMLLGFSIVLIRWNLLTTAVVQLVFISLGAAVLLGFSVALIRWTFKNKDWLLGRN